MKGIMWIGLLVAIVGILMLVSISEEASATRQAQSIDLVTSDVILNTTSTSTAYVTSIGGGNWDGLVNFTWYNTSGVLQFQENILPDGVGYAYSNFVPDEVGMWDVNASWTVTPTIYDNESFTVSIPSIHVIDNGIANITWNEAVSVNATFFGGNVFIGQNQGIKLVVRNSSSFEPIKGVDIAISVTTSEGETVVGFTEIGETNVYGELYYTFDIPVDPSLENRFMEVEVNIHDVDYSDIFGWLYNGRHPFFVGYFIEFTNESAHPIVGDTFDVFDNIYAVMNYTMGYQENIEAEVTYQFVNVSGDMPFYTNTVEMIFTPSTVMEYMIFPVPINSIGGLTRINGFIKLCVPNTDETIMIFREIENFTINNTEPILYNNLPYPISVTNVSVGDSFCVEVDRMAFKTFDYSWIFHYDNQDSGKVYSTVEGSGMAVEGTVVYSRTFTVPRGLVSGNYTIHGQSIYTLDGYTGLIEWESDSFYVESLVARASSSIDVITNETRLELDGSFSHGYNDTYWGVRWTSTHYENRTWYGLHPVIFFNTTGRFMVTLNMTDGNGNFSEESFDVYAFPPFTLEYPNNRPVVVLTDYLSRSIGIGENYTYDFDYVDVDDPEQNVTFSLSSSAGWLSIDPETGVLSGISEEGTYYVTVIATDEFDAVDRYTFTLTVSGDGGDDGDSNILYDMGVGVFSIVIVLLLVGALMKMFDKKKKKDDEV